MKAIAFFLVCALGICQVKGQAVAPKIDSLLAAYANLNKFNGNVLVSQKGKVLFQKAYGFSDAATGQRNKLSGIFQLASLTKTFTATLILKLVEEGKLSLATRLSSYFPELHPDQPITVAQLLNHSSGIYEPMRAAAFREKMTAGICISQQELLSLLAQKPLDFVSGTAYAYCNVGYDLLGLIIERATGMPYGQAVKKYIFDPLRMRHSGYDYAALADKNKVKGYRYLSSSRKIEAPVLAACFTYASGGLYSTLADLSRWNRALKENKIITAASLAMAQSRKMDEYGYGWYIDTLYGRKVAYHAGNLEGATSYLAMVPQDDICVIMLNNQTSTAIETIGNQIIAILYQKPYVLPKPPKAVQLSDSLLNSYVGNYDISDDYRVAVKCIGQQLYLQVNEEGPIKIFPEKEGLFFVADSDMTLLFKRVANGGVQLTIREGLSRKVGDLIR